MESQFWLGVVAAVVAFVLGRIVIRGLFGNNKVSENTFEYYEEKVDAEMYALKERINRLEKQMSDKVDCSVFDVVVQKLEERLEAIDDRLSRIEDKIDRWIAKNVQ